MILLIFSHIKAWLDLLRTCYSTWSTGIFGASVGRTALLGACLTLQACATPAGELKDLATQNGFNRSKVRAEGFDLLVFDNISKINSNVSSRNSGNGVLHVYLEGDGTPWTHRTIIMPDPTPRNPLMLRLMRYERNASVYVGRPCYNGFAGEPECNNSLWTSARYSDKVVRSMASAIRALAKRHQATQLWLMGHSGGGALAMLLADQLPQVTRVVTIAGNLDTEAWTSHHRYTPLYSSINPATAPALRADIWQWHLIGNRDTVIPAQLVKAFIMAQQSASGFQFSGFNHGCCWERIWPDVLNALAIDEPRRVPGTQFKFRDGRRVPLDSL